MNSVRTIAPSIRVLALLSLGLNSVGTAQQPNPITLGQPFPAPEKLSYRVEWRMVTAGDAKLQLTRSQQQNWQITLLIESAGLVSRLYRIQDNYKVSTSDKFCGLSSTFEAQEGKRHVSESLQFDAGKRKAIFDLHDLAKNRTEHQEIDIVPCTHEVIGALAYLRTQRLDASKSIIVPIANGKKMASVKIEAQSHENISIDGKSYSTMRYEAFIFDNVLFRRKGSLLIWLTDDVSRTPVQLRFQMGFPIGNITLELEKSERG